MDVNKLKYFIADRGQSIDSYVRALEISKASLYRKMAGKTDFTMPELEETISFLHLSADEFISTFFNKAFRK